jgi:hypothetical protein
MNDLTPIQQHCRLFADAREALSDVVTLLNDQIEALKRKHLADIKRLVARAAERHAALKAGIEAAPELFEKPRTHVFHGIKVGYQKGKGGIEISDEQFTLQRIKDLHGCSGDYLRVIEKPNKDALAQLPAADLKRLGCTIVDTGDQVVIRPTDTAVDKLVTALLKEATEDAAVSAA